MSEPHVVDTLEFSVGFADEDTTFDAQSRLADFLRRSAQNVIDSVFDEFDRADEVNSFESLEVDLGRVTGPDLEDQWARRLRERLRDLLWHEIVATPAVTGANRAKTRKDQARLDRLMHFLSTGYASWRDAGTDMRKLARSVFAADAPALMARVRECPSSQFALNRLLAHLEDSEVGAAFTLLAPHHAREIDALLDRYFARGRLRGLPAARRAELRRQSVIAMCGPLLSDPASANGLANAMDALVGTIDRAAGESGSQGVHPRPLDDSRRKDVSLRQRATADKIARSPVHRLWNRARLRARLQAALASGEVIPLAAAWREFLKESPDALRLHLLQVGGQADVRRTIVDCFADGMLLELVGLFVPTDRGFIEAAIRHVDETARSAPELPAPPAGLKAGLWEFTLAHLLVDRGSAFNRRSYLGAMLQMVALRESIDFADLLRSMTTALQATGVATGLPRELLQVLMELSVEQQRSRELISAAFENSNATISAGPVARTGVPVTAGGAAPLRERFSAALDAREFTRFGVAWREVRQSDAEWAMQELRRQGQAASLRTRLAFALPEPVLAEVAELFAPGDGVFVASAIHLVAPLVPAMLGAPREAVAVRRELWEFTLTYLLVDRGSAYNKRSYMDSLLRQMAVREAIDYVDILAGIRLALDRMPQPGTLQRQMRALVAELASASARAGAGGAETGPAAERGSSRSESLRAAVRSALADASGKSWLALLHGAGGHGSAELRSSFLVLGRSTAARERLIATLPAEVRPALLALLLPQESRFIAAAIADTTAACVHMNAVAVERPLVATHLWEFTLTFVLTEQGSGFNRRSYATYLLRKLASRHGLQYRTLLRDITTVLQAAAIPAAPAEQSGLLHILLELARLELPLADAVPGRLHPSEPPATAKREAAGTTIQSLLASPGELSADAIRQLRAAAETIVAGGSMQLAAVVESMLRDRNGMLRCIDSLPDHVLSAWLYRLRPADHYAMQRATWHILQACRMSAAAPHGERLRLLQWQFLLRCMLEPGGLFSVAEFARRFAAYLAEQLQVLEVLHWQRALLASVALPVDGRDRDLVQAIRDVATSAQYAVQVAVVRENEVPDRTTRHDDIDIDPREPVYVANAGLVLLAPYLPRLFDMRGLLADSKIAGAAAQQRAILLMHHAVYATAAPAETELVLNKILCGAEPSLPFDFAIRLDEADRSCVDGLLQSVIGHWSALGSTSVAGLRESFLQREGRLLRGEDGWDLHIAERGIDVLLDRLPWGFSTIKYSWMEGMLHVTWR